MESRTIKIGDWDYIVYEDGRVFFPKREYEYYRGNTLVKNSKPAREAKYNIQKNGYKKVGKWLQHRLVAMAFLPEPENPKMEINHKDGNKLNNHWTNLEWVTHKDNIMHWIDGHGIGSKTHPLAVYDLAGNFINVYASKAEVAKDLGLHKSTISDVVNGKYKQSGGYTFKPITKEEYYAQKGL